MVAPNHIHYGFLNFEIILFFGIFQNFITSGDAEIPNLTIGHQNNILILFLSDDSGHRLGWGSSHSSSFCYELLILLFMGDFATGIPQIVVRDVLGILVEEELYGIPVAGASSGWSGVVDKDGVFILLIH